MAKKVVRRRPIRRIREPESIFLPPITPTFVGPTLPEVSDSQAKLEDRVTEIEGDLVRIVDLIVKGDIESQKFKDILTKRQGATRP